MAILHLHHFTLRCDVDQLAALKAFYVSTLGLVVGDRPDLRFPGYWLYADQRPVVHLFASGKAASPANTGLDHIAFEGDDAEGLKSRLAELGVDFREAPVPGWPLTQIFFQDPLGLKIEVTVAVGG